MFHNRNGLVLSRLASSVADSIVSRLTRVVAWALGRTRDLAHYKLTLDDCEKRGLPAGTTEPHIYTSRIANARWWHVDVWSDGDCLHLRALRRWSEIHYIPKDRQEAATA
jgi:hypothetical protein